MHSLKRGEYKPKIVRLLGNHCPSRAVRMSTQMRKTLAVITLSLGVAMMIILYRRYQPLGNRDDTGIQRQVAIGNLAEISTLPCLLLSASPNLFQDNYKPTPDNRELSSGPFLPSRAAASFRRKFPWRGTSGSLKPLAGLVSRQIGVKLHDYKR